MSVEGSGWDAVIRVPLDEPWAAFWIDVFVDPPMGVYLHMSKMLSAAVARADEETLTGLVHSMRPLVGSHNIVDRDGQPLEPWVPATMGARLIRSISDAIKSTWEEGAGAPADPPTRRTSSRGSGSPRSRSRRSTPSGVSRSG